MVEISKLNDIIGIAKTNNFRVVISDDKIELIPNEATSNNIVAENKDVVNDNLRLSDEDKDYLSKNKGIKDLIDEVISYEDLNLTDPDKFWELVEKGEIELSQ